MDIRLWRRSRRGVATAIMSMFIVLFIFSMMFFVFGIVNKQATAIGNTESPGALGTADYFLFTDLFNYSPAILVFTMLLLVIVLSQRRNEQAFGD